MNDNDNDNDNYDDIITCKCGSQFPESDFKYHFHNCSEFNLAYKKLDIDLSTVFKKYSPDHNSLKILKFILQSYIHLFTKKLHSKRIIPNTNDATSFTNTLLLTSPNLKHVTSSHI